MGGITRQRATLGAAALALACALGCGSSTPSHVVLISIDSLRADHLGTYGYSRDTSPHLDALARAGTVFERALSTTSWTLPAHAALFTGLGDDLHGVQHGELALASGIPTLSEQLGAAGFATGAVVSGPFLHPRFRLYRGFDDYLNCMGFLDDDFRPRLGERIQFHEESHDETNGECVVERGLAWLGKHRGGPAFLFLHFWDVHYDYQPAEAYRTRFDADYDGDLDASNFAHNETLSPDMDPRDLEHLIALYDAEIAQTDALVGRVLEGLDALGLADSTLVVVTADHGDAFFEHGEKGHKKDLHAEVLRVPLLLRGPGVPRGVRRPGPAHLPDVTPTILELVGIPVEGPGGLGVGRSLVPALRADSALEGRVVFGVLEGPEGRLEALEGLDRKIVRDTASGEVVVYDLGTDPDEREPAPADAHTTREIEAHSAGVRARGHEFPDARPVGVVNPLVQERLRELGYGE